MPRASLYEDSIVQSVRMPRVLRDGLRAQAEKAGVSLNGHLVGLLDKALGGKVLEGAKTAPKPTGLDEAERQALAERAAVIRAARPRGPNDCPHPRARRQKLGYVTRCVDCGERVEA